MVRDADRKAEHGARIRTIDRMRRDGDEFNGEPESRFIDTSSTLRRQRTGTGSSSRPDDEHRRSMPYRESDDEDTSQAERARLGGRVANLFK